MPRHVSGLFWSRPCPKPDFGPEGKKSLAKRAGLAFESRLAAALPLWTHETWFQFQDTSGLGFCQPDLWLHLPGQILVLECKLTWTQSAAAQITHLYAPVLGHYFGVPVKGVVLCKNLLPRTPRELVYGDLSEALAHAKPGAPTVCHWPGRHLSALGHSLALPPTYVPS